MDWDGGLSNFLKMRNVRNRLLLYLLPIMDYEKVSVSRRKILLELERTKSS